MATDNPVPSKDPSDFAFNVEKLDEVVNAEALVYTDRLGEEHATLAGLRAQFPNAALDADRAEEAAGVAEGHANTSVAQAGIAAAQGAIAVAAAEAATGAAAYDKTYTTTALGLAGTTNGQLFGVKQPYGDAADVYLNSSGTAVAQGFSVPVGAGLSLRATQLAERSLSVVPPYPYTPIFEMCAIDQYDKNGKYLKNRRSNAAPSGNLAQANSGLTPGNFTSSGLTKTHFYANGPQGNQTAIRVQLNNGLYSVLGAVALPAGTYTFQWKAKSNPGAGSQDFKFGLYTTDGVTATVTEAGWTTVTKTITSDGVARHYCAFWSSGGTSPTSIDMLIDEFQWYAGNSIPVAYTDEAHTPHAFSLSQLPGSYVDTGGDVTGSSTSSAKPSAIILPSFPLKTSYSAMTLVALAQPSAEVAYGKLLTPQSDFPQFWVGFDTGSVAGSPPIGPTAATTGRGLSKMQYAVGRYPRIVASRFSSTERMIYINGVPLKTAVGISAISVSTLGLFGDNLGVQSGSIPGQFGFIGVCNDALVFDRALTDAEVQSVCDSLRQKYLIEKGVDIYRTENWWIAEGDSITAYAESYEKIFFDTLRDKWYGANIAADGAVHSSATQRLPTLLKSIAGCIRNGYRPIVSYFMGANGIPTNSEVTAYSTAVRGAGAKLVMCTILPKGSDATWETNRNVYNAWLRANPSLYDGLADFGNTGTTMGAFGSPTTNAGTLWTDTIHPNAAGHALLEAIIRPVVLALGL